MTQPSFSSNQRAVSNMVSVLILTGVILVGLGSVTVFGYTQIGGQQAQLDTETATNQMQKLSQGIHDVTNTPKTNSQVIVNFGEQGAASVQESTGYIDVSTVDPPVITGYKKPDDACSAPVYGDDSLPNQPIYECPSGVANSETNVTTVITSSDVTQPGFAPIRHVSGTVDVGTSSGTVDTVTVYLYDSDGDYIDEHTETGGGTYFFNFNGVSYSDHYRIDVVARDSNGDTNAQSVNEPAPGETAPPSVNLVPGAYAYSSPSETLIQGHELGAITYAGQGDTAEVAYQGGAIFTKSTTGTSGMSQTPNFELRQTNEEVDGEQRPDTLVVPITKVTASDNTAISSTAYLTDEGTTEHYDDRYLSEGKVLRVEIISEYGDAWRQYFRDRFGDTATVRGNGDVAIAEFGEGEELYVHYRTSTVNVDGG